MDERGLIRPGAVGVFGCCSELLFRRRLQVAEPAVNWAMQAAGTKAKQLVIKAHCLTKKTLHLVAAPR